MGKPITRSGSTPANGIPFPARKIRKITTKPPTATTPPVPTVITARALTLTLNPQLDQALAHLRESDPLLAPLISAHPPPTFFPPPLSPPFLSLTRSILYQQLATSAAASIYARFLSLCGGGESTVLPSTVLSLSPAQLRAIGVSGRKSSYIRDLAERFMSGSLTDEAILGMGSDEEMIAELTMVKGIGVWTVHMFMMFNLGRGDVLPVGDLGVRKGVMRLYGLKALPNEAEMERVCEKWRPYRSVGAWYMWRLVEQSGKGFKLKKEVVGRSGDESAVVANETLQDQE